MVTRAKAGIHKPKTFNPDFHVYTVEMTEPKYVQEALNSKCWKDAMEDEITALRKNNTWVLVPYEPSQSIVGSKWVFKVMKNGDRNFQRCKARLVAM